jgi:hypothetical protein
LFHIPDDLHAVLNFDSNFITLFMSPITTFINHKEILDFRGKSQAIWQAGLLRCMLAGWQVFLHGTGEYG